MAQYNGSIELISGLVQKNNQDFPLVNAKDVAVYKTEKVEGGAEEVVEYRLDTYLDNIGISEADRQSIISEAATKGSEQAVKTIQPSLDELGATVDDVEDSVEAIQAELKDFKGDNQLLQMVYKEEQSMLYLYQNEEPIEGDIPVDKILASTTITGGGGGQTSNYKLTLTPLDEQTAYSTLLGRNVALNFKTELLDGEEVVSNVSINFTLYINDKAVATNNFMLGEASWDITKYITLGVNNIRLLSSYTDVSTGISVVSSKRWSITAIQMYITSTFDDSISRDSEVVYTYIPYGSLTKTIYFILDGEELTKDTTDTTGRTRSITIPAQAHGSHTLEVYCKGMLSATEEIESEHLYYDIIWTEAGNATPVIRAVVGASAFAQYSSVPIYYSVYTLKETSAVELAVDGNVVSTPVVDRTEQLWDYRPMDFGTKTLTLTCGETVKTITLEIEKFAYDIAPVTAGLEFDFNPAGRTNQDADFDQFKNGVENDLVDGWTLSENFDWVNGGWKRDEKGEPYFCIKAGTWVDFNYKLFNDNNTVAKVEGTTYQPGNGKEFKIIFKTANAANSSATWLTCQAPAATETIVGLQMDVHNGYVKSSVETLTIPYSENDVIEFDMNIVPATFVQGSDQIDMTQKDIPMIMTYEDGTPVQPLIITNYLTSFKQVNAVPITIGSEHCDVHIYRMKAYGNYLQDEDILNNFIADARSGEDIANRFLRNQIYDAQNNNKLTPEALAAACPDLRVIKISAPRFTNDKKDKVEGTTIEMIYKNGDPILDNWTAINCIHNGQGTSSNEYGYAGRNLELNMKVKKSTEYTVTRAEGVYGEDGEFYAAGKVLPEEMKVYANAEMTEELVLTDVTSSREKPGTTITLGDGKTTVKKVSLTRDSVETNYFNVKVNIASSEQANNALLQKRYDRYLPYEVFANLRDENIKNNMNFFNCVIFVKEENEDLTTHQEFNDNEYHFYSIGNIGDSKKTDDSRANDPDDTTEFCVEIMDWNRELSSFPTDTMVVAASYKDKKKDEATGTETESYRFLKPENLGADGILFEKTESGYVHSLDTEIDLKNPNKYYIDILENDDFSEDYTYGFRYLNDDEDPEQIAAAKAKWIEFYRFVTRELKTDEDIAAWKEEFKNWFILDAALYYYLFTLRYTMVDNRAKNSFWHYGKHRETVNGITRDVYKFDFWDYDNDTALGIDNAGKLEMSYGVEDQDTDAGGSPYFRAHDSQFFTRVATYFAAELAQAYKDFESKNNAVFSADSLINEFDTWQSQFPEELWRLQYERIYKRTYVGGYGDAWDNAINPAQINKAADTRFLKDMMNGKKKYQRRQFERNQDVYMSSKFGGMTNTSDTITLRGAGNLSNTDYYFKPDPTITITPYSNIYINLHDGTKTYYSNRCYAGETYTIPYSGDVLDFIYIRGGSYMQDLGDLSNMYLQTATLNAGTRLKTILLGNPDDRYDNSFLKNLDISTNNKLLEELDVQNISALEGVLPVSGIPSLKRLYAKGTNVTSIAFANNGLLEEAELPASVNSLQFRNLYYLQNEHLHSEGYEKLTSLLIENTPGINSLEIVEAAPRLAQARINGIDWALDNTDVLNRLLKCYDIGSDSKVSVLEGKVWVPQIRKSELEAYNAAWPDLEVTYQGEIPQYTVTFKNQEEVVYTMLVDENTQLTDAMHDPVIIGAIETPTIPDSADGQYTYTFSHWTDTNGNKLSQIKVVEDITLYAQYTSTTKLYTISWYNENPAVVPNAKLLAQAEVEWGGSAAYPLEKYPSKDANGSSYYLFDRWNVASTNITEDRIVYAIWSVSDINKISASTDSSNLTPVDLLGLSSVTVSDTANDLYDFLKSDGDVVTVQTGYMPDYNNIESEVLTSAMKTYTGNVEDAVNTGIKLFDEDKSFTLAIDFSTGYSQEVSTLASCYYFNKNGFAISTSSTSQYIPRLSYKTNNTYKAIGHKAAVSGGSQHREICVIRKIKGDQRLYIYTNNRYSLDAVQETLLGSEFGFEAIQNTLWFGAQVSSDGSSKENPGIGTVYYAKIWYEDLGTEECKKICSWIYDTLEFEYVGARRYYYTDPETGEALEGRTKASFISKNLLDEPMSYNLTSVTNSKIAMAFAGSDIRTWLNTKVFAGIDIKWQQLMKSVNINSLKGFENTTEADKFDKDAIAANMQMTSNYLYLPSAIEMDSSFNNSNKDLYELEIQPMISGYSIFADNESRFKSLETSNLPIGYWTRSPYLNQSTFASQLQYSYGVAPSNAREGAGEVVYSYQTSTSSYDYFRRGESSSQYGVALCFSF